MEQMKIGWSRRTISMEGPISLHGQSYIRVSEGIHDPLYVTAMAIDGGAGQDTVIFCSCDVINFGYNGVLAMAKEKIRQRCPALDPEWVIFNATHTHTGGTFDDTPEKTPDGAEIYPSAKYSDFFAQQCAEAVCEAWINRKPGGMAFGYGYAVVGHSRRTIYTQDQSVANPMSGAPNGFGSMYGSTKKSDFSHYEAGADHFLNAMYTFDEQNQLTGIVINVPCPSQTSETMTKMSADYWNEVRQEVADAFGASVYVLPQCAAAGDLSPRILHYMQAQARRMELKYGLGYDVKEWNSYNKAMAERKDIAKRIIASVKEIYDWAKKDIQTCVPVRHLGRSIEVERRRVSEAEKDWCLENIEKLKSMIPEEGTATPEEIRKKVSQYNNICGRNMYAVERYETETETICDTYIHTVRIGQIAFATCRPELYQDFMHRLQARSPFIQTFMVQLCDERGRGAYLCTERGAFNKGYSASLFCNVISPKGGQQIVEEHLKTLQAFMEETQ